MRFSVVYEGESQRWAVVDYLTSDKPISYYKTEWDALSHARTEERRWRTHKIPCPRQN